jgi:glycosyltransferase involved in cell wall biosynthesis
MADNPLKILIVHNHYQQIGGEANVAIQEGKLLQDKGHTVNYYFRSNDEIKKGIINKILLPFTMIWSIKSQKEFIQLLLKYQPDVVHIHNTFFMISPSIYSVCRKMKIPVVQSLHNPRLMCIAGSLYRNGKICEICRGKMFPWPGILHKCYRKSIILSTYVSCMLLVHNYLKTIDKAVKVYVLATQFYRQKFIDKGINADKIIVKPHFIYLDPICRNIKPDDYALYIGRLDPEKGIFTMLNAWLKLKDIPLKIRGNGQLFSKVKEEKQKHNLPFEFIEALSKEDLTILIKKARFVVFPSEGFYETFGFVITEAFSCGVPVITSKIGVMAEIVQDKKTGLFFKPSDSNDLAAKVRWAYTHEKEMIDLGLNARKEYETKYSAEGNYKMLIDIYHRALSE